MARVRLTDKLLRKIIDEALAPAGGASSVKALLQSLVEGIGEKLKGQYPPEAVDAEMKDLATQVEALIRSSVAKLKSGKAEQQPAAPPS